MKQYALAAVLAFSSMAVAEEVPTVTITEPAPQEELTRCAKLVFIGCVEDDMERFPAQPRCCTFEDSSEENNGD
jgi:hypothetical protein